MLYAYKLSREEIKDFIIKNSEKTKDNIYWCPKAIPIILESGLKRDLNYYYPRSIFKNKVFFTPIDFEYFLARKKINNDYAARVIEISEEFLKNNSDTLKLKLKDKVYPYDFSVEELLNNFIYFKLLNYL